MVSTMLARTSSSGPSASSSRLSTPSPMPPGIHAPTSSANTPEGEWMRSALFVRLTAVRAICTIWLYSSPDVLRTPAVMPRTMFTPMS